MDKDTRLNIYTHDIRPSVVHYYSLPRDNDFPEVFQYNWFIGKEFSIKDRLYYHDMVHLTHHIPNLHSTTFLFCPKDRVEPFKVPTLVKSRPIHNHGASILMNMNYARHFQSVFKVDKDDIPFHEKQDRLVWRGADTGCGFGNNIPKRDVSRETLVQLYADHPNPNIDIGIYSNSTKKNTVNSMYSKPSIELSEMLKSKYLLSVEGNDVSTNLKWILYSNSVPFCPPFTMQSWILEDQLKPWEHYIPLRSDFLDMEDKLEWAFNHPTVCQRIASQGREYMKSFLDPNTEKTITRHILSLYAHHVNVIV